MSEKNEKPQLKDRKNPQLWQSYLIWDEVVQMRKRHTLRLKAIERGDSNMDAEIELYALSNITDAWIEREKRNMAKWGEASSPQAWAWATSIKGIGDSLAAQLFAQIDDISTFENVSQLWRFAGGAVFNGQAERGQKGEKLHYNKRLKSICYLIVTQFLKAQTPLYCDLYYQYKEELRVKFPEKIKVNGAWKYNDGHLHNMAIRKVGKIFLQHLWLVWRTAEGFPTTRPYIHDIGGHSKLIPPPNWPLKD